MMVDIVKKKKKHADAFMTGEKSRFSVEGDLQIHKIMQLVEKKRLYHQNW